MRLPGVLAAVWAAVWVLVGSAAAEPLFENSVVSNDLEFIRTDDPGAAFEVGYRGTARAEMPDKRSDVLFVDGAGIWQVAYGDGAGFEIWTHPDVQHAQRYVGAVAAAASKLPEFMRITLDHVVIHAGNETAFAEDAGHFFVLYTQNIAARIGTHDLEETVFHESVHATLDAQYARSSAWQAAQRADGGFVTRYAARLPEREDMAESALFAFAMIRHPGRLPAEVEARVRAVMPNRLAFFERLF